MADFQHLSPGPQASERQQRVMARDQNQMHLGWLVCEQRGDLLVDGGYLDEMVIIKNQEEQLRNGGYLVHQRRVGSSSDRCPS
jgi:hypothetical protein